MTVLRQSFKNFIESTPQQVIEVRGIPHQTDEWEALDTLVAIMSHGYGRELPDEVIYAQVENPNALWPYAILHAYYVFEEAQAEGAIYRAEQESMDRTRKAIKHEDMPDLNLDRTLADRQSAYAEIQNLGLVPYLIKQLEIVNQFTLPNLQRDLDMRPSKVDQVNSDLYLEIVQEVVKALFQTIGNNSK